MLRYKIFKVKDGKMSQFRDWCAELKEREPEVLETLVHENVVCETYYHFEVGSHDYVAGIQWIEGIHEKADMSVELNRKHFETLQECLEPVKGTDLCSFSR
jgi:hypothetical protein